MNKRFFSGSSILGAAMVISLLFSSCSREITSLQKTNQLAIEQSAPQPTQVTAADQKQNIVQQDQTKKETARVLSILLPEQKEQILSGEKVKRLPTALALAKNVVTDDVIKKNLQVLGPTVTMGKKDVSLDSRLKLGLVLIIVGALITLLPGGYIWDLIGGIIAVIGLVLILLWLLEL